MSKTKVSFGHVITFYFKDTIEDQEDRKCHWMTCAADRERFKNRIKQFEKIFVKSINKVYFSV